MIRYSNKPMLPDEVSGNHVIFWPERPGVDNSILPHPLFKIQPVREAFGTLKINYSFKLGSTYPIEISYNYHLIVGICLMGPDMPDLHLPTPNLKELQTCLKKVGNYCSSYRGDLHISTYPLYYGNWNKVLPVIQATCQGLDVIIHQERLEPRYGIQIDPSLQ